MRAITNQTLRWLAALALATGLAACGGGSDDPAPAGNGNGTGTGTETNPPAAVAPAITTQPSAQNVTAPTAATFTVVASGTAPLAYQWRSSSNGSDWSDIAGATGASYGTGATAVGMNGRYYSVSITNSAGSVVSAAVQLGVQPASTGAGGGEFPHTPNPLAVRVTPAAAAVAWLDVVSQRGGGSQSAYNIPVADGVTAAVDIRHMSFLEPYRLAVTMTPVALADLDAEHPLPFQSVAGAFNLAPADPLTPELQASRPILVQFRLTQATLDALDALGGQVVVFSARADGTQLHLVPVVKDDGHSWSSLTLTTQVHHLGIFGIASISDAQAAALAAGWPEYTDFQFEAAVAPPSYEVRKAGLAAPPQLGAARTRPLGAVRAADAGPTDWAAQMQARIDAYYQDVVTPALNAANAADADSVQFRDAIQKVLQWERMRQLLEAEGEPEIDAMQTVTELTRRGIEVAKADCAAKGDAAAEVQMYGMIRQAILLGVESEVTDGAWIGQHCKARGFDISVKWTQVRSVDVTKKYEPPYYEVPDSRTERSQMTATVSGTLRLTESDVLDVGTLKLDYNSASESVCATGAYRCTYARSSLIGVGEGPVGGNVSVYVSTRTERWNLDARGHMASPTLYVWFQNMTGYSSSFYAMVNPATLTNYDINGNATTRSYHATEDVNTVPWSGTVNVGTSSRIIRRPVDITGQGIEPGSYDRMTTSLTFTVVEKPRTP